MEYHQYRLEYPKHKQLLFDKLMKSPDLQRLSTFGSLQEEISYLINSESQRQSNLLGQTYIRDILWLENEETIGICGLILDRSLQTASWQIMLLEPYATSHLGTVILLEYLSIAKCLLLDKVVVDLPHQGMHSLKTLRLILENNGFQEETESPETNIFYSIELRNIVEDLRKFAPPYSEPGDKYLECRGCGNSFIFSTEEQILYHEKGFVHPKRCPKCRLIKKIALQNVHSESLDSEESNQTLQNVCYSWRYKGTCRYSSECRYIHEDLSSVAVLYDLDMPPKSPKRLSNTRSFSIHDPPSDTTDSALSSIVSSDPSSQGHHQEFVGFPLQSCSLAHPNTYNSHNMGNYQCHEYFPAQYSYGYILPPGYPQLITPIFVPCPYTEIPPQALCHYSGFQHWAPNCSNNSHALDPNSKRAEDGSDVA